MMKRTDVMIDIETLAATDGGVNGRVKEDAVIVQIGCVFFDPREKSSVQELRKKSWMSTISSDSQKDRVICPDTVAWWKEQDSEVYREVMSGTTTLSDALDGMVEACDTNLDKHSRLWARGDIFDVSILRHALFSLGKELEIPFWNVRCLRPIEELVFGKGVKKQFEVGNAHDAIDDAIGQARLVQECFRQTQRIRNENGSV